MRYLSRVTGRIPQPWRSIADWGATIALAIGFVLAFEAEVAKPFRIPSGSMEPTLHCAKPAASCLGQFDDRVIADRLTYRFRDPRRGEIVVFHAPPAAAACGNGEAGVFVKRLIGLPGEQVAERQGSVFVDGRRLQEPYVDAAYRDLQTRTWPRIAPGHYFFMGDDRVNSCDSRTWGTVARSSLIGPAIFRYWPLDRIGIP
jgi:signal peptidase I